MTPAALNSSQVLLLRALAAAPRGLDTEQLKTRSGVAVSSGNIGPVFRDVLGRYPGSLYALGLVRVRKGEGEKVVWEATPAGRDAAEEYRTRRRPPGAVSVPGKALDPVVRAFMPTRTYGLELYTDADIAEIRAALGDAYADADTDDLRMQIVNRRKQGAFTDARARLRRKLQQFERALAEHGLELTEESSAKLSRLLMEYAE